MGAHGGRHNSIDSDKGCVISPKCRECPLTVCIYELPKSIRLVILEAKDVQAEAEYQISQYALHRSNKEAGIHCTCSICKHRRSI